MIPVSQASNLINDLISTVSNRDNRSTQTGNNMELDTKTNEKLSQNAIRLICISDTHNMHRDKLFTKKLKELYQSPNDILLHAGDVSERGTVKELSDVNEWFGELPYKHIVVISGNMDGITLDNGGLNGHKIYTNATYLEHESTVINFPHLKRKISIFGSPYTPKFYGGFQIPNDNKGKKLWSNVPNNIDILVTHGPPKGIFDQTSRGWSVGDKALRNEVERIKPKVMVFGHVHPSHGKSKQYTNGTIFANVAMHDKLKNMQKARNHKPIVIDNF